MIAGMTPAQKGHETKMRNELLAGAPQRKDCPHCGQKRLIKFFGVRVEHDQKTKDPLRALFQSRCTPCRRPATNVMAEAAEAAQAPA